MKMGSKGVKKYDDVGGFSRLKPGRYHVYVSDVNEKPTNRDGEAIEDRDGNPKCMIEFEALAGTNEGCKGSRHSEFFGTSEKAMPRLVRFAMCVGILEADSEEDEVDMSKAIGKQLVIELVEGSTYKKDGEEKQGFPQISYAGMWAIDHDDVDDVPKGKMLEPEELAARLARRKKERDESGGKKSADWGKLV